MNKNIQELLEYDFKCRSKEFLEKETDLFNLEENPVSQNYPMPTLCYIPDYNAISKRVKKFDTEEFKKAFFKQWPYLKNIFRTHTGKPGVLIAGGSVCNTLIDRSCYYIDVDIFLYDMTLEEAEKETVRIFDIIEDVKGEKGLYVRTKNTITDKNTNVQIIFRLYKSKSEILHGFDLGSSAVGFDGQEVYFTSLSQFSYKYMCNIIDTSRRSTTYEQRLIKYLRRGFNIIVPEMDIEKVIIGVNEMPYLTFNVCRTEGNKIILENKNHNPMIYPKGLTQSDYESCSEMNEDILYYINISRIFNDEPLWNISQDISSVFNDRFSINVKKVNSIYESLVCKMKSKDYPVSAVKNYLPFTDEVLVFSRKMNCREIIDYHLKFLLEKIEKINSGTVKYPVEWIIENPGTQISGSFNPVMDKPGEWYGDFRKKISYLPLKIVDMTVGQGLMDLIGCNCALTEGACDYCKRKYSKN